MRTIDADELLEHVYRDKVDTREAIAEMVNRAHTLNVPFSAIRKICKYYSISRDMYNGGEWESACHHPELVLSGDSWGNVV